MKYIKLAKDVKADDGNIFKAGSVIQILTTGTKLNPSVEVLPMNAFDEQNLPYRNGVDTFTFAKFNEKEHKQVKPIQPKTAEFNYPGSDIDTEDDGITLALKDAYADKDFEIDINGTIEKKSQMQKEADAFNQTLADEGNQSTDFSVSVGGEDEPGVTDNYKEDVAEKPTPAPMMGALSKVKELKKKILSVIDHGNLLEFEDDDLNPKEEDDESEKEAGKKTAGANQYKMKKQNNSLMPMEWGYYYLNNGQLVNEDGNIIFNGAPLFKTPEEAEQWLEDNDERGNVLGYWDDKLQGERDSKWSKKKASELNKNLSADDVNNIDYDLGVDGSDTVDKSTYKADEKEMPAPVPLLGELAKKINELNRKCFVIETRNRLNELKTLVRKAEESFKIDNVTDGDSGGKNLLDYSWSDSIEDSKEDEFRPKEVKE